MFPVVLGQGREEWLQLLVLQLTCVVAVTQGSQPGGKADEALLQKPKTGDALVVEIEWEGKESPLKLFYKFGRVDA